ncbi:MAG: phosphoribosylanthranilate isomerase [Pseudomonadota bacterium]
MAPNEPQIKICGLRDPDMAAEAAALGADAIGCVFFAKSPRNVSPDTARAIRAAVPDAVGIIGVFADIDYDGAMSIVDRCGLDGVQLHGHETAETVARLRGQGLIVLKALFTARAPGIDRAGDYDPTAFLVEAGKGPLPGGNAETWQWQDVRGFSEHHPLVLAGGLNADTVAGAIATAAPDAVDVSSGVEIRPGVKSLEKIAAFIAAVRQCKGAGLKGRRLRKVF